MADEGTVRAFGDRFFRFGVRRADSAVSLIAGPGVATSDPVFPTKGLEKFLSYVNRREAPVILDLGPVVGLNVTFFGEHLGCKIFVEDLFADVDRFVRRAAVEELADFFERRLTQTPGSVDGVLCWDLFDYLERRAAESLARQLVRVLRPGGALLGFFGDGDPGADHYTKYAIVDAGHLEHRPYTAARGKRPAWGSRDVFKLFNGLSAAETYWLKIRIREMLFRKPRARAFNVEG